MGAAGRAAGSDCKRQQSFEPFSFLQHSCMHFCAHRIGITPSRVAGPVHVRYFIELGVCQQVSFAGSAAALHLRDVPVIGNPNRIGCLVLFTVCSLHPLLSFTIIQR